MVTNGVPASLLMSDGIGVVRQHDTGKLG